MRFVLSFECENRPETVLKSLHGMLHRLDGNTVSRETFFGILNYLRIHMQEVNEYGHSNITSRINISLTLPALIHRIQISTNYYTATLVAKQIN